MKSFFLFLKTNVEKNVRHKNVPKNFKTFIKSIKCDYTQMRLEREHLRANDISIQI